MPKVIDFESAVSKIRDFYSQQKRLPSYSEIAKLFKYKSTAPAFNLANHLIKKGILEKDSSGKLIATNFIKPLPKLLGSIQAGFPSPAEEELPDLLSLDEYLIKKPQATYIVKAVGDSMIDEGIKEGDLLLVERGRRAQVGDVVVAQVDGDWTLKYYEKKNGKVVLRAANKKYPLIEPKNELIIGGVVIANVRKYK